MNAVSNDLIKTVTWQKPARVGASKIMLAAVCYNAAHRKRNIVVYQPTDTDAKDWAADDLNPALEDIQVMTEIQKTKGKNAGNTLSKKVLVGSTIHILGGKSPNNYRRITKDFVAYDELSGFDRSIGSEGTATKLGDTRLTNSPFPCSLRVSTPTIENACNIEDSYKSADYQFQYYVPCVHCNEFQLLELGGKEFDYGVKRHDESEGAYMCSHCHELMHYNQHQRKMVNSGQWRTEDGICIIDGEFYKDNEMIEAPYHVGFKCNSLISPFITWRQVLREFFESYKNPDELRTFTNVRMGETFTEVGEVKKIEEILALRGNYNEGEVNDNVKLITAGVDIGLHDIHVEVRGFDSDYTSWQIYSRKLFGDIHENAIWNSLQGILDMVFDEQPIAIMCIDEGYQRDVVRVFAQRDPRIIPIKGSAQNVFTRESNNDGFRKNMGLRTFTFSADMAKDKMFSHISRVNEEDGRFWINQDTTEEYCESLTTESKVETKPGKFIYKKHSSKNHFLDATAYSFVAAHLKAVETMGAPQVDREAQRKSAKERIIKAGQAMNKRGQRNHDSANKLSAS